jgi:hypothetical protein
MKALNSFADVAEPPEDRACVREALGQYRFNARLSPLQREELEWERHCDAGIWDNDRNL